jgi:hypothetical protein
MSPMTALSSCPGVEAADPTTTAVDTTSAPPSAWQNGPVNVTLTGVATTMEWEKECVRPQTVVAPNTTVTISGEGTHVFSHRAVDGSNRGTAWIDETVNIDTTAPTDNTTVPSGWQWTATNVTVTGTDALSGVASVR